MHPRTRSLTLTSALLIGLAATFMIAAPDKVPLPRLHGTALIAPPARRRAREAA